MAVIEFIKNLLTPSYTHLLKVSQSDIGVVTPYKMQRRKITQACHRLELNDITIGTAEAFQGQEKPIMIVSTVRSGGNRLGFVNNARVRIFCVFNSRKRSSFQFFFVLTFSALQRDDHSGQVSSNYCGRSPFTPL